MHSSDARRQVRTWLFAALSAALIAAVLALPRIEQDPAYHAFADQRALLGLPNALDVLSNLPFCLVGLAGLVFLRRAPGVLGGRGERLAWAVLFVGLFFTGVGSAYYHLAPTHATLFWDRLPMAVGFMGLLAALLAERLGIRAQWLVGPLVLLGAASVMYWYWTETRGVGDLRPYIGVQAYPLLAIPLLLALFPPRYTRGGDLLVAAGMYVAAKALEVLDGAIFALGAPVSGHTLKHLAAAAGAGWLLRMLKRRRALAAPLPAAGGRASASREHPADPSPGV